MKIKVINRAIDAINLSAIIRSKSVDKRIPVYFRNKEPPIISYEYNNTIARKLINVATTPSNVDITNYLSSSQRCRCKISMFWYNWQFNDHRECEADRACFQKTKIPRAKQAQLECHRRKCSLSPLIFMLNCGLNGNK